MKHYELLFILKPTLTEEEVSAKVDFVKEILAIAEVERIIRITEDIIKFLTVKFENKKEIAAWEKMSKGIKLNKKEPKVKAEEAPAAQE